MQASSNLKFKCCLYAGYKTEACSSAESVTKYRILSAHLSGRRGRKGF